MQAARELHAVDILALERALLRFSTLVLEQRWIAELDINPLLVRGSETIALDARVILHPGTHHTPRVPRPAIRPYPEQYAAAWRLRDGTQVSARPIRPEDEPLMVTFHSRLSEASVYSRYFAPLRLDQRIDHLRLARVCFADYERELPLVALVPEPPSSTPAIAAVGRINRVPGTSEAEFALLVADAWQGRGLGARLLNHLLDVARQEQITCLRGLILAANQRMLQLVSKAGFRLERTDGSAECVAVRRLGPARGRADATAAGGPPQR
jgi:acetyltransferase